jgi:hypothetical protein
MAGFGDEMTSGNTASVKKVSGAMKGDKKRAVKARNMKQLAQTKKTAGK